MQVLLTVLVGLFSSHITRLVPETIVWTIFKFLVTKSRKEVILSE